jgi:hypothetical protein
MMRRLAFIFVLLLSALSPMHSMAADGGGGFCLFELPDDGSGKLRFVNLTIVQFVELGKEELKIVYGGGALGSGYEAKVALKDPEEGKAIIDRMRKTAGACNLP